MLLAYRNARPSVPVVPVRPADLLRLNQTSSPLLAVALAVSVALAALTTSRIVRVERDFQPALDDARHLGTVLEATRLLLRDGRLGPADLRIARADSLSQEFHRIATSARLGADARATMLAYDATFASYYVAGRRSAAGLSMSPDADGSSAEDASLGYAMLRENVADGTDALERAIDATRPATAPVELVGWMALALLSAAALLRRAAPRMATAASLHYAADDHYVPVPAGDGPAAIPLQDAVERLARRRLAASIAAARVAKRNNERQIELARTWNVPMLTVVPASKPTAEMDVYEEESAEPAPSYGGLSLVTA
ncbi:MAG TPA: hypothetical protein VFI52_17015 [Gemmatimonadaceae bacterium]|nr:hypothetical protein [Gemmatimonadaceae bacterium]